MFTKSLGQRVPIERVAKEVKAKGKLDYNPEIFSLVEGHEISPFWSESDCVVVLRNGPWFAVGQLMAMVAWESDFILEVKIVRKTVVCL